MRLLGTLVIVLVLLSTSAHAQSVTMAELAGTWVATSKSGRFEMSNDTLHIRPDSTFEWAKQGRNPFYLFTGDSLFFLSREAGAKITLKEQQLTLTLSDKSPGSFVAQRVSAPKSTP